MRSASGRMQVLPHAAEVWKEAARRDHPAAALG